jgi:hypothetical protein
VVVKTLEYNRACLDCYVGDPSGFFEMTMVELLFACID